MCFTQYDDACGDRTQGLSIRSPNFYHYATAPPNIFFVATTLVEIESSRIEQPFVDIRFKSTLTVTHIFFLKDPKRKSHIKGVKKIRSAVYQ